MFKIVCFGDTSNGRLRVDSDATARGKQNPTLQGKRILLIYKTHIHTKVTLDPKRCAPKIDAKARSL